MLTLERLRAGSVREPERLASFVLGAAATSFATLPGPRRTSAETSCSSLRHTRAALVPPAPRSRGCHAP